MPVDRVSEAYTELDEFLKTYSLAGVTKRTELHGQLKQIHKRLYALLVWVVDLSEVPVWPQNAEKNEDFGTYLAEATSDICQAVLLFVQGLYKPANLLSRSAIENLSRCIGLYDDQKALALTSVYELLELVSTTKIVKSSGSANGAFVRLQADYAELCKYVHSVGKDYMSLSSALQVFPRYQSKQASEISALISRTSTNAVILLTVMFKERFRKLHHTQRDDVLSILPKTAKREIMQAP